MTQIRVGDGEVIVYTCKCGVTIKGEGALSDIKTKLVSSEKKETSART